MGLTQTHSIEQLTARDLACLLWIGQQYAIRFDQLQRLLLRYTPQEDRYKLRPGADRLSMQRTYQLLDKWKTLRYVECDAILRHDKTWTWLTRAGLRCVSLDFNYNGHPAKPAHLYYINQIRLSREDRYPDDHWTSEREILHQLGPREKGKDLPHIPDGIITNIQKQGKQSLVEVELHAKTESELDAILRELAITSTSIFYFTTTETMKQIQRLFERSFPPEMQKPFRLYHLREFGDAYDIH